jgi:hypothetical protein
MTGKKIATKEKKNAVHRSKTATRDQKEQASGDEKAVLTTLQQQSGNRAVQRLLEQSTDHELSHMNNAPILRKPTQPTLIKNQPMDRIEDAYGSGSLNETGWRNQLDSAKRAFTNGDVDEATRIYLILYNDIARLAQANQVLYSTGAINRVNWDQGKGTTHNAKPGLNFTLASYGEMGATGKTAYVDQQGEFGTDVKLNGEIRPFAAIILCRDAFRPEKEQTLAVLRHEMVHAEHLAAGKVEVSDHKVKSGGVDKTKANTELLAYVEGFMTMFHLSDPASISDNHPAFLELLGVLDGSSTYAWAWADPVVRSEGLGRLQEYYYKALSPQHQRILDAWVNMKLGEARSYGPSSGSRPPGSEDFFASLRRVMVRPGKGVRTPMKL